MIFSRYFAEDILKMWISNATLLSSRRDVVSIELICSYLVAKLHSGVGRRYERNRYDDVPRNAFNEATVLTLLRETCNLAP